MAHKELRRLKPVAWKPRKVLKMGVSEPGADSSTSKPQFPHLRMEVTITNHSLWLRGKGGVLHRMWYTGSTWLAAALLHYVRQTHTELGLRPHS
jgi:hypothetical protein